MAKSKLSKLQKLLLSQQPFPAAICRPWKDLPHDALLTQDVLIQISGAPLNTIRRHVQSGWLRPTLTVTKHDAEEWLGTLEQLGGVNRGPGRPRRVQPAESFDVIEEGPFGTVKRGPGRPRRVESLATKQAPPRVARIRIRRNRKGQFVSVKDRGDA